MNVITILIWVTIAIIAAISIIAVKLHYKGDQLESEEGSILPSTESINNALSFGNEKSKNVSSNTPRSLSPQIPRKENNLNLFRRTTETKNKNDAYIVPENEDIPLKSYGYHSENQVLINYDNDNVNKFQEPIKENQMDIMTQNNKDTSELKDLFTIDELIKESKRKDSEREKESQTISKPEDDAELDEIKQSIKNKKQEPLIEEVISENETPEPSIKEIIEEDMEEKISDIIYETPETDESEIPSIISQKDGDEAETASTEKSEDVNIAKEENITEVLSNQETPEKISEPSLKTPHKISENKEIKSSVNNTSPSNENKEETMDLDYRKDLDKFTKKIKGSKIFQEVKEKLTPETEETPERDMPQEDFIRNVNEYDEFNEFTPKAPEYDEYEPIINETHMDMDASYEEYHSQRLRQENTKRVFNMAKNSPEPEVTKPRVAEIKNKPERGNIKINLNNNEVVLKKGDEIIFNHAGETYSSQVYAINGDDISVKYRRKNIKIKPSDVKKIY